VTEDYPPGQLTSEDYPHLIKTGGKVQTIAVSRVLAVRDWPEESAPYQRLARLAEHIYAHFDELQRSGRDSRWQELSLSAVEPGWPRFQGAQDLLDRDRRGAGEALAFESFMASRGLCSLPESTAARVRFYNDFTEWRTQSKAKGKSPGADRSR
jgi:hypothetical protein